MIGRTDFVTNAGRHSERIAIQRTSRVQLIGFRFAIWSVLGVSDTCILRTQYYWVNSSNSSGYLNLGWSLSYFFWQFPMLFPSNIPCIRTSTNKKDQLLKHSSLQSLKRLFFEFSKVWNPNLTFDIPFDVQVWHSSALSIHLLTPALYQIFGLKLSSRKSRAALFDLENSNLELPSLKFANNDREIQERISFNETYKPKATTKQLSCTQSDALDHSH